jgi:hypothetical protein
MRGLGRPFVVLVLALLAGGCGGGGGDTTTTAAPCNDAAFRGQDEELYVTKTAVANARGGGDPATLLLDLRRARRALGGYLDAHPPCAADLREIGATERTALDELSLAIAALEGKQAAGPHLAKALASLQSAQTALLAGP